MQDMHTHSYYSPDSSADTQDNIKMAITRGIKYLAFTDHIEKYSVKAPDDYAFDLEKYSKEIEELQNKYKDDIKILKGLELGMWDKYSKEIDQLIKDNDFDFIIGSIHGIEGNDITKNIKTISSNPVKWINRYYDFMYDCVKNIQNFHILGHIDYIDRYFVDKSLIPDYEIFMGKIEKILDELIKTDRGIEYNIASLRRGLAYGNPKDMILEKYHDMGGQIITVSSDSHTSSSIGQDCDKAIDHLKNIGFTKLAVFEKGNMDFLKI